MPISEAKKQAQKRYEASEKGKQARALRFRANYQDPGKRAKMLANSRRWKAQQDKAQGSQQHRNPLEPLPSPPVYGKYQPEPGRPHRKQVNIKQREVRPEEGDEMLSMIRDLL